LIAARGGAEVIVMALPSGARFALGSPAQFRALLAWLEDLSAAGRVDWTAPLIPPSERAVWIGDLAGAAPELLVRAAPRGTALRVVQVLAPHEIEPRFDAPVVLVDPEGGERLAVEPAGIAEHARALERHHDALC